MSANDASMNPTPSPSNTRTRRHRHSLPEDFAQTHQDLLAQIRSGTAEPADFEDEEEVGAVSDGEVNERDTLAGGREIVALCDEDLEEEIRIYFSFLSIRNNLTCCEALK